MYQQQWLRAEISRLMEEQIAAQASGVMKGMTVEESLRYKERHLQIKNLREELAKLDHRDYTPSTENPREKGSLGSPKNP